MAAQHDYIVLATYAFGSENPSHGQTVQVGRFTAPSHLHALAQALRVCATQPGDVTTLVAVCQN